MCAFSGLLQETLTGQQVSGRQQVGVEGQKQRPECKFRLTDRETDTHTDTPAQGKKDQNNNNQPQKPNNKKLSSNSSLIIWLRSSRPSSRAGETVGWFRALAALPEDSGLVSSSHSEGYNHLQLQCQMWPLRAQHAILKAGETSAYITLKKLAS